MFTEEYSRLSRRYCLHVYSIQQRRFVYVGICTQRYSYVYVQQATLLLIVTTGLCRFYTNESLRSRKAASPLSFLLNVVYDTVDVVCYSVDLFYLSRWPDPLNESRLSRRSIDAGKFRGNWNLISLGIWQVSHFGPLSLVLKAYYKSWICFNPWRKLSRRF